MERRKDSRIKISGDSFVTGKDTKKKVGRIVDISNGGMAFHYLNTASIPGSQFLELGIWLQDQDLFIPNILVHTVSDILVDYQNPYKQIPLRRRSVQFRDQSLCENKKIEFSGLMHPALPQNQSHPYLPPLQT